MKQVIELFLPPLTKWNDVSGKSGFSVETLYSTLLNNLPAKSRTLSFKRIQIFLLVLMSTAACNRPAISNTSVSPEKEQQKKAQKTEGEKISDGDKEALYMAEQEIKEDKDQNSLSPASSGNFKQYYEIALTAHNSGDFQSAIQFFTKALQVNEKHTDSWAMRGISKLKSLDNPGACADWQSAINLGSAKAKTLYEQNCD